jgi:hypothetical protein
MKIKTAFTFGALLIIASSAKSQTANTPTPPTYVPFSQLSKGSFNINASIGYTSTGTATTNNLTPFSNAYDSTAVPNGKTSSFSLSINPGYLIANGLQVDVVLDYTGTTTVESAEASGNNQFYSWNNISSTFKVGLGMTKFLVITRNLYFKCAFHGYYNTGSNSNSFLNDAYTLSPVVSPIPAEATTGYNFTIDAGLEYFPAHRWGINFNLNNIFNYASTTADNVTYVLNNNEVELTRNRTTNTFNIGAGLTPTIAIRYVFGKIISSAPAKNN